MSERVINLGVELISPCFLGGAYQQPEFRIASLRGIWRYWYRALYGDGQESDRPVDGEAELFGTTEGRGRAILVPRPPVRRLNAPVDWQRDPKGAQRGRDYLLFTMDMNKRQYLLPGQHIALSLRVRGTTGDQDRASRSLACALAFQGIGARSRRMAGAVQLLAEPPSEVLPTTPASDPALLAVRLNALVGVATSRVARPGYHVVARDTFTAGVLKETFSSWETALDAVGDRMRTFRLRMEPDYGVAKAILEGKPTPSSGIISRAAFGLPLTFRFRAAQGWLATVQLPESDRRGSPLFLTLERLEGGRLAVVWSLFRAPLSPNGRVQVKVKEIRRELPAPGDEAVRKLLAQPEWASHVIAE
jgi:CRISPR/Cas system CMR-associated protein Cmr1 (group 7 of RAMP superfamily)